MAADEGDSFFSRWSRRKAQDRAGLAVPAEAPAVSAPPVAPAASPAAAAPAPEATEPAPPPPTLEDAQDLTPASDFRRFVARDVSPEVRNAAVKKLFADPHFNVMDGLDIYIDDYTKTEPIPAAMLAKMASARFLKLVDDPDEPKRPAAETAAPEALASTPSAPAAEGASATEDTRAPDAAAPEETAHHDHADLQLQPDHAPGPQGPGPGAG